VKFRYGLEHEIALINSDGAFADFTNTAFSELEAVVETLPVYPSDYPQLRIGDAGIKHKRWYIEGFERYDLEGKVLDCPPKGIEIRTTICDDINTAVAELTQSYQLLKAELRKKGFRPTAVSFNPYQTEYIPDPPLNMFEQKMRGESPEAGTAHIHMLTQGPDISLSAEGLSTEDAIDAAKKLTYYSPYLVPFSFNSPFYNGKVWNGLSVRTYVRTGRRPAAMVFMDDLAHMIDSAPSLTQKARVPAENGRIEFKAFDSSPDFGLYAGLGLLLKGLILEDTLYGRAVVPDGNLHQRSAATGFDDPAIRAMSTELVAAAQAALDDSREAERLEPLRQMLATRRTPAHALIDLYRQTGNIEQALVEQERLQ